MKKSNSTSTSNEKVTGLIYVLFLFLITAGICGYILFIHNSDYYHFANGKKDALSKLERVKEFQNAQSDYFEKITDIDDNVNNINPNVNASYLKQNLFYTIGVVKKISSDNKYSIKTTLHNIVNNTFKNTIILIN